MRSASPSSRRPPTSRPCARPRRRSGYHPFIIAKIERSGALDQLDEILEAADGIMIARGDLGVEMPIEQIAVVQKHLMRQANLLRASR